MLSEALSVGVAFLCEFSQTVSQDGGSTELINKKDNIGGRQVSSSGSDKDASFGHLTDVANVLESTAHAGHTV